MLSFFCGQTHCYSGTDKLCAAKKSVNMFLDVNTDWNFFLKCRSVLSNHLLYGDLMVQRIGNGIWGFSHVGYWFSYDPGHWLKVLFGEFRPVLHRWSHYERQTKLTFSLT